MKTPQLEKLSDEELSGQLAAIRREMQHRITEDEKRIDKRRRLLGQDVSNGTHGLLRRRRHTSNSPLHRQISAVAQLKRRAKERNAPKAEIEQFDKKLQKLRDDLQKQKAAKA